MNKYRGLRSDGEVVVEERPKQNLEGEKKDQVGQD